MWRAFQTRHFCFTSDVTLQVEGSEDTTAYVMAASYLLSKIDTNVDPCDNFPQYSCGAWTQNQWRGEHRTGVSDA